MPTTIRKPYKEKQIKDLTKDDDFVSVTGYPVLLKDNYIVIDDGHSTITIYTLEKYNLESARFLKAFGKIVEIDGRLSMQADFIQDLSKIDTFLYNKVRLLLKK